MPKQAMNRKLAALGVFDHPAFKRNLPPYSMRAPLMAELRRKLTPKTFALLLTVEKRVPWATDNVKIFHKNKNVVAIKDTRWLAEQGFTRNPKTSLARKFLLAHHRYYRKNKLREKAKYILRSPKIFGRIGNFLVMEYIKEWKPKTKAEAAALFKAKMELANTAEKVAGIFGIQRLQVEDFIPAGIYNGKFVFYAVYDYI